MVSIAAVPVRLQSKQFPVTGPELCIERDLAARQTDDIQQSAGQTMLHLLLGSRFEVDDQPIRPLADYLDTAGLDGAWLCIESSGLVRLHGKRSDILTFCPSAKRPNATLTNGYQTPQAGLLTINNAFSGRLEPGPKTVQTRQYQNTQSRHLATAPRRRSLRTIDQSVESHPVPGRHAAQLHHFFHTTGLCIVRGSLHPGFCSVKAASCIVPFHASNRQPIWWTSPGSSSLVSCSSQIVPHFSAFCQGFPLKSSVLLFASVLLGESHPGRHSAIHFNCPLAGPPSFFFPDIGPLTQNLPLADPPSQGRSSVCFFCFDSSACRPSLFPQSLCYTPVCSSLGRPNVDHAVTFDNLSIATALPWEFVR
jgi:hypothetical protein